MKIYVSGKISDLPYNEVVDKFNFHSDFLELKGYEVVNPITISPYSPEKQWHDYMLEDIKELFSCEAIYMLDDWKQSRGARIEHNIAQEMELTVYKYGDDIPDIN